MLHLRGFSSDLDILPGISKGLADEGLAPRAGVGADVAVAMGLISAGQLPSCKRALPPLTMSQPPTHCSRLKFYHPRFT